MFEIVRRGFASIVILATVLVSCGSPSGEDPAPLSPTTSNVVPSKHERADASTTEAVSSATEIVGELAKEDLGRRLDRNASEIFILAVESVTWPDGALGCPEPGLFYTQATVRGFRVVLDWGGETFYYHAGSDGVPFFCPEERVEDPEAQLDR
jgi:hypothetical protein